MQNSVAKKGSEFPADQINTDFIRYAINFKNALAFTNKTRHNIRKKKIVSYAAICRAVDYFFKKTPEEEIKKIIGLDFSCEDI